MTQYIDKDAVVAEIDRLIERAKAERVLYPKTILSAKNLLLLEDYDSLKKTINKIEVKEVDLEEKATKLSQKYFPDEENIWARSNIEAHKCKSACIEIIEWFKAQKGE